MDSNQQMIIPNLVGTGINAKGIHFNTTKKRNWYIMSPMKIPKQPFYNQFFESLSLILEHVKKIFCFNLLFQQDMTDFDLGFGENWRILIFTRLIICFYWIIVFHLIKKYNLLIFEPIQSQNRPNIAKTIKQYKNTIICSKTSEKLSENW